MLTDQQLTETALRFVITHLTEVLDPAYEMSDYLDRAVCAQHCPGPGGCDRTEEDWPGEEAIMKASITTAVSHLREELIRHAALRGIALTVEAQQCPHCTSERRHRRFVMPTADGTAYCNDVWHDHDDSAIDCGCVDCMLAAGWDEVAARMERWAANGRDGDWQDAQYDEPTQAGVR